MPESPIRKLVPYAEKAKKQGIKIIHLNIGQPDIKTPQIALDAVKKNTLDVIAYSRTILMMKLLFLNHFMLIIMHLQQLQM